MNDASKIPPYVCEEYLKGELKKNEAYDAEYHFNVGLRFVEQW